MKKLNLREQEKSNPSQENKILDSDKSFKRGNREIVVVTYIFVGLFVMLMAYLIRFIVIDSSNIINNAYNERQSLLANRVVRGEIQGNNGEVLAKTIEDEEGNSTRIYPYDEMFAHVVGKFDKGKTGLEASESFNLLTSHTNPIFMLYNELSGIKNPGDNIVTTLDVNLQEVAYKALGNQRGAIIVLEPSTGKILAMVSKPDYNPNKVQQNWKKLNEDSDNKSALVNRATQGLYPPGSTYKIVTALQYIKENEDALTKYSYICEGHEIFEGVSIKCYNGKKHGELNLISAFAKSCNTSFADIGTTLDVASFRKLNENLLFNKPLPTNISYKQSSFVLDGNSDASKMPQTSLGQGETLITPFHNALITAAIANGGTLMNPYLVDHITNYSGQIVKKNVPTTYGSLMNSEEAKMLTELMTAVVKKGTATSLTDLPVSAGGKTGSAEYNSSQSSHAWFVGFAPTDKPEIVVSIIVEGAGTGSAHAVPIAKKIMNTYFKR